MRVLILSDNVEERQRATSALALRPDVDVIEADSVRAASRLLDDDGIDMLVVDADLQPEGGFSWLYKIRQQAEMNGTDSPPAIVLVSRDQDQFLTAWSGAEAMLHKPVDGFVLARRIGELVKPAPAA